MTSISLNALQTISTLHRYPQHRDRIFAAHQLRGMFLYFQQKSSVLDEDLFAIEKYSDSFEESKMDDVELCFNYLQQQTQCASNCGSCKPEVKKMIQNHLQATIGSSGMIG